jgi:hypothetical protein
MTMRATVTRDMTSTTSDWGTPDAPSFVEVGVIACRAWSKSRRDQTDSGKTIVIEDMRAMVPSGADVEEGDQLTIRNRMGNLIFDGPVAVEAKQRKGGPGSAASYDELMLMRHK